MGNPHPTVATIYGLFLTSQEKTNMHDKQNTCVVRALTQMSTLASRGTFLKAVVAVGAIALAAGFSISWVVQAEAATNATVTLSPQGVAFPPPEYAGLSFWDHPHNLPPDFPEKCYNGVRGRDAYELLAAIYGGRPSDYWAPGIWEWNETLRKWRARPLSTSDPEWIGYPPSYGVPDDDVTDHNYPTGHSVITLRAGQYQLGQGVISLGKYGLPDGSYITRNSITIKGAGKDKTFLNGDYARDSLYAWTDDEDAVTVTIRDLSISSSVGTMASVGFTLSNVRVDIPFIAHTSPQFATFGFKNDSIAVWIDNSPVPDHSIGDVNISSCEFIADWNAVWISALDYVSPSSRNLTITGNTSFTGSSGILIMPGWGDYGPIDGYANKVVTNNHITLRRSYSDEEARGYEGILCDTSGPALIANNDITVENNAPNVWGIEIGTIFPAIDIVVKNNRIYQTFSGLIGGGGGGFGITVGGYWGQYTASHDNILIGNNLSNVRPSLGAYYLGQDAYDNIIAGNAGTVGYDGEPSPIPNNFITGLTPMAGAPHIGPQMVDALQWKLNLLMGKDE